MKNRSQKSEVRSQKTEDRSKKSGTVRKAKLNGTVVFYILSFFCILFSVFCLLCSVSFADEICSRSAVVMDASTGRILYAKNPDLRLPPASTTKLMTAIVVLENADLADIVTVSKNASMVSPSKAGFKEGDKVTIETLLYAALMKSANDAAVALAEAVAGSEARFVELMNKKAVEIGAYDTKFINPHGLPGPGQYTTASDLSKIMNYALIYPILRNIIGTRVTEISTEDGDSIFLKNTNKLLWSDQDLVGGKTGYTRRARHCFVCAAERDNDTVIVALLGSPSRVDLWKESEFLIGQGFKVIGNKEEPVIHITKVTYDTHDIKKKKYRKSSKLKAKRRIIAKKIKKQKKTKIFVKKRSKTKNFAKHKNKDEKNYKAVENIEDRDKG
jgi:D-alanyl-D-alanine carboxypeptidase (penicillin-binding protein 5/6)